MICLLFKEFATITVLFQIERNRFRPIFLQTHGWFYIIMQYYSLESPNTGSYFQMTMQELCSALNQEDAKEIKAVLEVMLSKLLPEVMSNDEKKNVCLLLFKLMTS